MPTAAEEWTRFCRMALQQLCRVSKRHLDAWAGLPALIRIGALRKEADGWYRIDDIAAFWRARLGCAVQEMQLDGSGQLTRVLLVKPDKLTRQLAAVDELRVHRAQAAGAGAADPLH